MNDELTPDRLRQIEGWVGRPLTPDELIAVASVSDLSAAHKNVFEPLALKNRLAAFLYLRSVVPSLLHNEALAIVDVVRDRSPQTPPF